MNIREFQLSTKGYKKESNTDDKGEAAATRPLAGCVLTYLCLYFIFIKL